MITTPERVLLFGALEGSCSPRAWNALVESAKGGIELEEIDLSGYDLTGLSFASCNMTGAKLVECRAKGVSFEHATLDGADFSRADLDEAMFTRAKGDGVRFVGSSLEGTDFSWAQLRQSDFSESQVADATFWKTDLRGAEIAIEDLGADQDCLTAQEPDAIESVRELLARIGGLTGKRFRLDPAIPNKKIEVPEELMSDPNRALRSVCRTLGLKVERTEEPETFEIVQK